MLKVRDLSADIFPRNFIEVLSLTCESCGSDNEVSESLTFLQCSNRKCPSKLEYRLYCMLQDLGVKGMSLDKCKSFLEIFDTTNPYAIFLYNPEADGVLYEGCSEMIAKKIYKQISQRRGMLLWEFIKVGNFPNLRESAEKIFGGYTDLAKFYSDLASGGIPFLQDLLLEGTVLQDEEGILVQAVTIYETLIYFKDDIEEGYKGVVILEPGVIINVLFAQQVNMDLINQLNAQYRGKAYFNVHKVPSKLTDIVVVDTHVLQDTTLMRKIKDLGITILGTNEVKANILRIISSKGV